MKQNHTHKFKIHKFKNGTRVFFCVNDCDYRIAWELSLGKMCICWRCGKPFQLNSYSQRLVKPHCEECHLKKDPTSPTRKLIKASEFVQAKPAVEQVMLATASRIQSDLSARLKEARDEEIKTPIQMLTEDELL